MTGRNSALALLLGFGMLLSVTLDPADVSRWIELAIGLQPAGPSSSTSSEPEADDASVAIAPANLRRHLEALTAYSSRVTGYEGARHAAEYIEAEFRRLGLGNVSSETFSLPVPIDRGGLIRLPASGEQFRLYGLWPNHVRTPTLPAAGIEGRLIEAGTARLEELDGKRVGGSIALVDFASDSNYLVPIALGARAILFYDNGDVTRAQAAQKFLQVPVDIPRFWIEKEAARALRTAAASGETSAHLSARMDWEQVQAHNIYGYLHGRNEPMPVAEWREEQQWKDQVIVVHAHYDAISVVPALAPGAESATGIAALLELASLLRQPSPGYTVLFLATAGHFQGLAGVNDFLYRHSRTSAHFRDRIAENDRIDFRLFIGLDLSSHGHSVGCFTMGTFYNSTWANDDYRKNLMAHYARTFTRYSEQLFADSTRYVDAVAPEKRSWKNFMPAPLGLDSEAAVFVGKEAISFVTPNQLRQRVDTPVDRLEYVDVEQLTRQTETIAGLLAKGVHDPGFFSDTKLRLQDQGHSLEGTVYWFDRDVNFAVPKAPVPGALVTYAQPGPNSVGGVRTLVATMTGESGNEAGRFKFGIIRNRFSNRIQAFELDEEGRIVSAPDMGPEGDDTYPTIQRYGWWENRTLQVLFRCRALGMVDLVDPRHLTALGRLTPLGGNEAPLPSFGYSYIENQFPGSSQVVQAGVVFAPPGERVKLLIGDAAYASQDALAAVRMLLTNADPLLLHHPIDVGEADMAAIERAQGAGFAVSGGMLRNPSHQAARDMWIIDDARMKQLAHFGIVLENAERMHEQAREALLDAQVRLDRFDYSGSSAAVRKAFGIESRIYPDVRSAANDTVRGVIFYFALLLPFAFFCERFFFAFPQVRRQIAAFAGIFVAVFFLIRWIHPAFRLSNSPYVIFLAFVILALGSLVTAIVIARFMSLLQRRKRTASGVHEADVGRLSAGFAAVILGISNLRKRRLRTALTATTLTLLTFTVSSFTSVQSSLAVYQLPRPTQPLYEGALVRDRAWRPMQTSALDYIESAFGNVAAVVPRAWYVSRVPSEWAYIDLDSPATGKTAFVHALVGLHPHEKQVSRIDEFLVAGRFFEPGDRKVCILPDELARLLAISADRIGAARIRLFGEEYRVIGIVSAAGLDQMEDLDGENLLPVDTVGEESRLAAAAGGDPREKGARAIESFRHLSAANAALLPYDDVLAVDGHIASVAISGFADPETMMEAIESFLSRVALTMFVGEKNRVVAFSSIGARQITGTAHLFIPILIASLIVLNTMIGAVYERAREIGIYSIVGLAPSHIGLLFIAESFVFAVFGAVAGYLIGQVTYLLTLQGGLVSGITLNFSSLSAVWATAIVMVTVLLSTLYPARLAAAMAVPDVTRRWELPPPEGDQWQFDFPFTVAGSEVPGIYAYLKTVFEAYAEGSAGDFVADGVTVSLTRHIDETVYELGMTAWLAPFDLGISQAVRLKAVPTDEHGIYRIETEFVRLSGDLASWRRMNRSFLNVLRKRFLVWRTLGNGLRAEYDRAGRTQFGFEAPPSASAQRPEPT